MCDFLAGHVKYGGLTFAVVVVIPKGVSVQGGCGGYKYNSCWRKCEGVQLVMRVTTLRNDSPCPEHAERTFGGKPRASLPSPRYFFSALSASFQPTSQFGFDSALFRFTRRKLLIFDASILFCLNSALLNGHGLGQRHV